MILNQEQIDYILANKDRKVKDIADELGIDKSTVYKRLARHGMRKQKKKIPKELIQKAFELYKDHTTREVSDMLGINYKTLKSYIYDSGIRHSSEFIRGLRQRSIKRLRKPEIIEKARKGLLLFYKMERIKALSGQPTKSYKLGIPDRTHGAKRRLRLVGYFNTTEDYVMGYDENTRRKLDGRFNEDFYSKKYGLSFEYIPE